MRQIFVNLKRFEVARKLGGVCPMDNPVKWIEYVVDECVRLGIGALKNIELTLLLPEALIPLALKRIQNYPVEKTLAISIGCQGVFREDIALGTNFGAFTTNRPATAMKILGCDWVIIGHSEERQDKLGIIAEYDPATLTQVQPRLRAKKTVDILINKEVLAALKGGLNVLLCVGETVEEKGSGEFVEQKPRIKAVLKSQLETGLKGVTDFIKEQKIIIGYEPIWAIGPGKIPPEGDYISFVSTFIKEAVRDMYGFEPPVVYGGGLKEENAAMIAGIKTIDGGLVALTRFSGEIGFYPEELQRIIEKYSN